LLHFSGAVKVCSIVVSVRILPLVASATEIVHALGLGEYQIGRSHECDYPAGVANLPVCTKPAIATDGDSATIDSLVKSRVLQAASVYQVDAALIFKLQPTHIVTQTQCKVCAVSLDDVENALRQQTSTNAKVVPLEADSLSGIWEDIQHVANSCGCGERGENLVADLQRKMSGISQIAHNGPRRRVAAIEWLEPLMCAGNWVPELLSMANADAPFGTPGLHSPYLEWGDLAHVNPDVIVAMPCGFDRERTKSEMRWMTCHPQWPGLRAVQDGEVFVCDGNQYMNRPGPRVLESLQIFAEILHPALFSPELRGKGWDRYTAVIV
jgi:iron complex transport system substrate-binding protein